MAEGVGFGLKNHVFRGQFNAIPQLFNYCLELFVTRWLMFY